ncbi:hypothetical protein HanPSC8_Chr16g0700491 [Helianthus annuus]|nr:hypothetical protein HanPSC8_Chr16g0700491 [Helianthus annuus]
MMRSFFIFMTNVLHLITGAGWISPETRTIGYFCTILDYLDYPR